MTIDLTDFRKTKQKKNIEYSITLTDSGFMVYANGAMIINADNIDDSGAFTIIKDKFDDSRKGRDINLKYHGESPNDRYYNVKYTVSKV